MKLRSRQNNTSSVCPATPSSSRRASHAPQNNYAELLSHDVLIKCFADVFCMTEQEVRSLTVHDISARISARASELAASSNKDRLGNDDMSTQIAAIEVADGCTTFDFSFVQHLGQRVLACTIGKKDASLPAVTFPTNITNNYVAFSSVANNDVPAKLAVEFAQNAMDPIAMAYNVPPIGGYGDGLKGAICRFLKMGATVSITVERVERSSEKSALPPIGAFAMSFECKEDVVSLTIKNVGDTSFSMAAMFLGHSNKRGHVVQPAMTAHRDLLMRLHSASLVDEFMAVSKPLQNIDPAWRRYCTTVTISLPSTPMSRRMELCTMYTAWQNRKGRHYKVYVDKFLSVDVHVEFGDDTRSTYEIFVYQSNLLLVSDEVTIDPAHGLGGCRIFLDIFCVSKLHVGRDRMHTFFSSKNDAGHDGKTIVDALRGKDSEAHVGPDFGLFLQQVLFCKPMLESFSDDRLNALQSLFAFLMEYSPLVMQTMRKQWPVDLIVLDHKALGCLGKDLAAHGLMAVATARAFVELFEADDFVESLIRQSDMDEGLCASAIALLAKVKATGNASDPVTVYRLRKGVDDMLSFCVTANLNIQKLSVTKQGSVCNVSMRTMYLSHDASDNSVAEMLWHWGFVSIEDMRRMWTGKASVVNVEQEKLRLMTHLSSAYAPLDWSKGRNVCASGQRIYSSMVQLFMLYETNFSRNQDVYFQPIRTSPEIPETSFFRGPRQPLGLETIVKLLDCIPAAHDCVWVADLYVPITAARVRNNSVRAASRHAMFDSILHEVTSRSDSTRECQLDSTEPTRPIDKQSRVLLAQILLCMLNVKTYVAWSVDFSDLLLAVVVKKRVEFFDVMQVTRSILQQVSGMKRGADQL